MIILSTSDSVERAIASPVLAKKVRTYLQRRLDLTRSSGVEEMTLYLLIEPGDSEADIERELGWSPLVNPLDSARYGTLAFHPYWDWLDTSGGVTELIVTVGNAGYAAVLVIDNDLRILPELLSLCRTYGR